MIKFQHFFKSHQISSNLQNLFESSSETCMWNMSPFREVDLFHRKMLTVPALEISWNFNIFSKFTNFYQTCKTYLNHHQNMHVKFEPIQRSFIFHADSLSWNFNIFFKIHQISSNLQNIFESSSETCMWNLSPFREVDLFHRKMPTVPALWNIMKFQHFFKVHQISSNLQNILESSSETCMWNLSLFREVKFFHRKIPTVPALEISLNFNIFSKVTKFHQTCRIYLNHHQKHACEIWAHSEKLTYFIEKCRQCRPYKYHEISTFFQSSPNFIKLAKHIWIIIRNMHVKFEPIQRSWLIS